MGSAERTDVIVVGAGASGAALTWRLARAGVKVTCLERGRWHAPEEAPQHRDDYEGVRLRSRAPNPNHRQLAEDYPVLEDRTPIKPLMFNGVGGSTVLWSAHAPRMHPSDFRVRTLDGVAVDWPISYWDLAPYYELNDKMSGVSGKHGDPANPPRTPRTTPPVPLGLAGHKLASAFDALGWHWWPADGQILTEDVGDRLACNGCGPCELGCPRRSRASADVTYWPQALSHGARLVTGATVTQVRIDRTGRATGVEWLDDHGESHVLDAGVVVLACNGIGTARLLLTGGGSSRPDGVANSSGMVGRNLMLHPIAASTGVFAESVDSWAGNTAFELLSQEFYETDADRGFVRGYEMQLARGQGPLITAMGGFALDIPWGAGHHERFDALFGHVASLAITCEDLPDPDNRIEVDSSATDRHGVPAARMIYRVSENSQAMIEHGLASARRVFEEAGAVEVLQSGLIEQTGFHLMGTARMGADPSDSVVGPDCRTHDVPNLMVVDGSVFATAAAVNPTPTIQALALRAADQLLADRGRSL